MRAFPLTVVTCVLVLAIGPAAGAETLRVGMAEADITPPLEFPMAGYYHERRATGTHDPLKARAVVFRRGDEQAALVVCDLCGVAIDLTMEVRRRASAKTGVPASNIVVAATHSHTSPDYTRDLYLYLGGDRPARGTPPYAAKLIDGVVEALIKAHAAAAPATIEVGVATQEVPVSFNRRFVMKDGSVRTWMRLDQPDVVRAAGPIDPEVATVLVRSAEGNKPLGVLSNFALHLDTVGGTLWSADYPQYIEKAVRKRLGPEVVSIFGNGCCGDINHVDPVRKERNKTDFIGEALARTIVEGLPGLRGIERPKLQFRRATVRLPLREVSPAEAQRARPLIEDARAAKRVDFLEVVTAYRSVILDHLRNKTPTVKSADAITWGLSRTWAGVGPELPVDVQVLCLGDELAIVCLPGEVFVELGLAIKRASPFKTTLVVELCNAVETAYIPTRAAHAGGSYEVTNSMLKRGAGEMLVEAALGLLRQSATAIHPPAKP